MEQRSSGTSSDVVIVLPDTRACWPVAVSAAVYVFFSMIVVKSEAVTYVGLMDMLHVNREAASWPLTTAITVSQLAGPLYGVLGLYFCERNLLLAGVALCSVPVILCALADSLAMMIFLYGILFGAACSDVIPYTVVARHFVKYRGSAMSLLFILTAVASFVSPLIAEGLRHALNFQYALVVLGGLQLFMVLGCIVVDRVPPNANVLDLSGCHEDVSAAARRSSFDTASYSHSCSRTFIESLTMPDGRSAQQEHLRASGGSDVRESPRSTLLGRLVPTDGPGEAANGDAEIIPTPHMNLVVHPAVDRPPPRPGCSQPQEADRLLQRSAAPTKWSRLARNFHSMRTWRFVHVGASRAVTMFVLISFAMTAVDFGKDSGLGNFKAVTLVTVYGLGDLCSRVGTGLALDFKILTGETVMFWGFSTQALAMAGLALHKEFELQAASCFLVGSSGGGRMFASTVMVSERSDEDSLSLSLGTMNFITGILCLFRSPVIGMRAVANYRTY
ncbi:hypothetical protein HPB48_013997 [Haemaphysalis longicornis]|uniref:Monocarboxylate transporter n=1 Tax=Haemaphysalis longicornis TaxID=44386 RepID=A0A9J6G835_HAELO|nr:hypothetical protein HPB48_013997 [Haemaphysalis longicornis]